MLHACPESLAHDYKLRYEDLAYLFSSEKALGSLAQNYVGLTLFSVGARPGML